MKKNLLMAAVVTALTISTASAFAAPLTISGDTQTMIQSTNGASGDYSDARFRINFDFDMGDGVYAHARLMGIDQQMRGTGLNYAEAGTGSTGSSVNMEQMYLGAKLGQVDATLGRQPVYIGRGMLADINGIQGFSLATNTGDVSLYGFGGRSGNTDVLAGKIGTKLQNLNLGAGYLRKDSTNFWSADADTQIADNVNLSGIYMKNSTAKADGFLVKATVGQAVKKGDFNYAVSYRNMDNNAVDGDWVTNGGLANSKGLRFEAKYKPTNNATLWVYQDVTKQSSDTSIHPNQFRAELDFNF